MSATNVTDDRTRNAIRRQLEPLGIDLDELMEDAGRELPDHVARIILYLVSDPLRVRQA